MTREQKRSLLLIAAAAVLLIGLHFVPVTGWLKLVLYLIPYLLVGGETLVDACKGIYNRQPFDENLLMAVATIGAMVLGDYPEAVSVMLFYQIGELFESYAVGRSRRNIGDLMDIRPDFAYVETADGIVRVKPEEVAVGDTIVVKPGERVPLDGTVLTGTSALNMSALTGESAPVDVTEGSTVVSGSVNLSGVLRLRVEKVYAESTVARILELVENSSLKKAHTERFITKFARVYTPSVCGAALALAILPPVVRLIMGIPAEWGDWIYRALTFLVISCPCALVISIPLSFFGGIGGASARGILIKGSSYLEMLAKTDRVVFDKTGTLTRGTFAVTAVHPAQPELSEQALLQLAAAAEQFSDHPVSQSLRRAAGELPADLVTTDAKELAGHGVTAQVGGRSVAAGNTKLMDTIGLTVPAVNETGTVIHVAADGAYLGYIVISDEPKTGSREAVARLRADGASSCSPATGRARTTPWRRSWASRRCTVSCCRRIRSRRSSGCSARAHPGNTLPSSATASMMRRCSRAPISAPPWAASARTPPSRQRTSCSWTTIRASSRWPCASRARPCASSGRTSSLRWPSRPSASCSARSALRTCGSPSSPTSALWSCVCSTPPARSIRSTCNADLCMKQDRKEAAERRPRSFRVSVPTKKKLRSGGARGGQDPPRIRSKAKVLMDQGFCASGILL